MKYLRVGIKQYELIQVDQLNWATLSIKKRQWIKQIQSCTTKKKKPRENNGIMKLNSSTLHENI